MHKKNNSIIFCHSQGQTPHALRHLDPTSPLQIRVHRPGQWFRLDNALIDEYAAKIGPYGVALYTALARYCNSRTEQCYPSLVTLSKKLGMTHLTARRALAALAKHGLVHVEARPGHSSLITLLDLAPPAETCPDAPVPNPDNASLPQEPLDVPPSSHINTRGGYVVTTPSLRRNDEPVLLNQREEKSARELVKTRAHESTPTSASRPERPDEVLQRLALDPATYSRLETHARAVLMAGGLKGHLLITPLIEVAIVTLWEEEHGSIDEGKDSGAGVYSAEEDQAHAASAA